MSSSSTNQIEVKEIIVINENTGSKKRDVKLKGWSDANHCCYCGEECNPCSQACGPCMRQPHTND